MPGPQSLLIGVGGGLVIVFRDELKQFSIYVFNYLLSLMRSDISIKSGINGGGNTVGNEKIVFAIKEELNETFRKNASRNYVADGGVEPNYRKSVV